MEKVFAFMIALSLITSATAAETATATTPAAKEATAMDMDCSKITDKAAKKECEAKAKEAPASENTTPMAK